MAWKFETATSSAYRCCFCCHVRTGALIIGLFHLLGHAVVLSVLTVAVLHPDLAPSMMPSDTVLLSTTLTPVLSGKVPDAHTPPLLYYTRNLDQETLMIAIILTLALMAVSGGLVYGTIRGQPKYVTPFLCIQVFDAFVTGMTMIGHLSNVQGLRKWIEAQNFMTCKRILLNMDDNDLMVWALVVFVGVIFVKMYFIGVVWACYKYLKTEMMNVTVVRHYEIEPTTRTEDTEMLLPPKYEDVILVPAVQPTAAPPPPAYSTN